MNVIYTFRLVMVMSILVNTVDSDEINTSEYFSYKPYEVGRGIQYESLGPVRLIGAQYSLITFFSLKEYNQKYELLGEKIKNITNTCTDQKHQDLCGKYQIVITDLYNEITKQKERMYMSLGSTMQEEKQRTKRGLINIIGNTMHTLFGVCDDKCTKKTQEAIRRTEESGTNILHIMETQTTVVKSTIKNIGNTLNQTEQLYNNITEREQQLYEKMSKIQNKTNDILHLLMENEIHNLYTVIINQYSYETETLGQIVTAAREGMIHPSLMTPQELASTLKTIEQTIKKIYSIPMGTRRWEINEFQKITKIRIYYSDDRLVFDIVIPLIIDTELTLYKITPVPMRHKQDNSSGWYLMDTTYNNIAVTKGYKRFTTYTDQQLNECKETSIYRICNTPQPMQENNERQPCEVQNFIKADTYSNPELCTVKKINLKRSIYQKLKKRNTWIHAGKETLTISCANLIDPFIIETNEAGEITINDISCQVFARDAVLTATEEIQNNKYKDFIPKTNMNNILEKIPEHIHKFETDEKWEKGPTMQFTDLHDASKSLDEVQHMINQELLREQNQKHQFVHSNLLYVTIVLALISIILIIAIYIMIKCKYIRNTEVMELPGRIVRYRVPNRNDYIRNYEDTPFTPPPSPR